MDRRMEAGFAEAREEFRAVRGDIGRECQAVRSAVQEELKAVRGEMNEELRGMRGEIGALNRTVIQFAFAVVGTIFLGFMGTIAALITLV